MGDKTDFLRLGHIYGDPLTCFDNEKLEMVLQNKTSIFTNTVGEILKGSYDI